MVWKLVLVYGVNVIMLEFVMMMWVRVKESGVGSRIIFSSALYWESWYGYLNLFLVLFYGMM